MQGIYQAASYIYKKLVTDGILNQAFSVAPVRSEAVAGSCISATEGVMFYFNWTPAGTLAWTKTHIMTKSCLC